MDTSNSAGGSDSAGESFISLKQIVGLGVSLAQSLCNIHANMRPLTIKYASKFARCQGNHVDTTNFTGGSKSAEKSSILLNQIVRLGVSLANPICHSDATTFVLTVRHVS